MTLEIAAIKVFRKDRNDLDFFIHLNGLELNRKEIAWKSIEWSVNITCPLSDVLSFGHYPAFSALCDMIIMFFCSDARTKCAVFETTTKHSSWIA